MDDEAKDHHDKSRCNGQEPDILPGCRKGGEPVNVESPPPIKADQWAANTPPTKQEPPISRELTSALETLLAQIPNSTVLDVQAIPEPGAEDE